MKREFTVVDGKCSEHYTIAKLVLTSLSAQLLYFKCTRYKKKVFPVLN
jgi:hypothetical protein